MTKLVRTALVALLTVVLLACDDSDPGAGDAGDVVDAATCTPTSCDDGVFCNGTERCTATGCVAGTPTACVAGRTCDEAEDRCVCDVDVDRDDACADEDCDDADATRYPGAAEICDDGDVDEDCDPSTFGARDVDMDGSYDAACCNVSAGGTTCGGDCDDDAPAVRPTQVEVCNGMDDDCDGMVDQGVAQTFYRDVDGDAFGVPDETIIACARPEGYATLGTDCDDTQAAVSPAAAELCNEIDDDCDGTVDDGCSCTNGQTRACPQPGACAAGTQTCTAGAWSACSIAAVAETCNEIDDDCDGTVDDGC